MKVGNNRLEQWICRAEIAYKKGRVKEAIKAALRAVELCDEADAERCTALRIFVARAYSKLGQFKESNMVYRKLIDEKIYIPPVIMGLLYNNFNSGDKAGKMSRNLGLIKIFVRK